MGLFSVTLTVRITRVNAGNSPICLGIASCRDRKSPTHGIHFPRADCSHKTGQLRLVQLDQFGFLIGFSLR